MIFGIIFLFFFAIILVWYFTSLLFRLAVIVLAICILWGYYKTQTEGFITTRPDIGPVGPAPFRGFFNEPSRFINFNLTEKPRASNGPFPIYDWWKNKYTHQLNKQYQECDQYRCQSKSQNGYSARPGFNLENGVYSDPTKNLQTVADLNFGGDCGYYENPVEFCNRYPQYEMCPNSWVNEQHPVRAKKQCDLQTPTGIPSPYI